MDVTGWITVNAANVTIRNCRVTTQYDWQWYIIQCNQPTTIEDCTLNGAGLNDGQFGIMGGGLWQRNNVYGTENPFCPGDDTIVKDNYAHDFAAPGGDPHYDGVQMGGYGNPANVMIQHNTIDLANLGQTGCVNLTNDDGTISDVTIDNNFFIGGSYSIFVDDRKGGGPITGITITNNHIRSGLYGYIATFTAQIVAKYGNVDADTGVSLD